MSERVIVIGASGHGKVAADIVRCSGDTLLGFLDDNALLPPMVAGIPVLGRVADYVNYPDTSFVIGIGSSAVREKIARQLDGVRWYTAIHPSAVISALDTEIGAGSVVMANAVVNPSASSTLRQSWSMIIGSAIFRIFPSAQGSAVRCRSGHIHGSASAQLSATT